MKTIELSSDAHFIKELLSVDSMYDTLVYDGSPSLKEYVPKGIWFILSENNTFAGIINLEPINNVMWNTHISILEQYRGNESEEWGKQVAKYMSWKLGAKKFLAITPYIAAMKYAQRVGFNNVSILKESIKKDGELLDQYLLELGAESIC